MTYIQLVNAVLRRLREDEVVTVSESAYSKLIGDFVNDAKREVEDAWNWIQLRSTIQINTTANTYRYTLTGSGDRSRVLQVLNDTQNYEMSRVSYKYMNKLFLLADLQYGSPYYWDINGNSSGDYNVDIYPVPNSSEDINFNMVIPQDDFTAGTDDDVSITVPSKPVILGAYAKAIEDRGEDGGTSLTRAQQQYDLALGDAIAIDSMNYPQELVWEVY